MGSLIFKTESAQIAKLLQAGYTVIVPDTEGQTADFAAGPEYGMTTLDSIRAAVNSRSAGLNPASKIALVGYSGGAIATDWAAQLAPTYAPDVNKQLVGAAEGGLLVNPAHNLDYIDGSRTWGGIAPAALAGLARAYGIDLTPYLSSEGREVFAFVQDQSVIKIMPKYRGLHWKQLFLPQYANNINGIPDYVRITKQVNLELVGSPTIPMYISQGTTGFFEGTYSKQLGDGVMLADDVRTLARQFCSSGTPVQYNEYRLGHLAVAALWQSGMKTWVAQRFAGTPAPNNCTQIPPG